MKTRQMGAIRPLRYYLGRVLRDMGGVSRTGPLSADSIFRYSIQGDRVISFPQGPNLVNMVLA